MDEFSKRRYRSIGELVSDIVFLIKNIGYLRNSLSQDFRERIMLAETQVNQCRYCNFLHTKLAILNGLSKNEITNIVGNCPKEQVNAILYAQYFADVNGNVDEEIIRRLIKEYGERRFKEIDYYVRMMKVGNYIGNSFDYVLYKIKRLFKQLL